MCVYIRSDVTCGALTVGWRQMLLIAAAWCSVLRPDRGDDVKLIINNQ